MQNSSNSTQWYNSGSARMKRFVLLARDSGREHKAWGASPRIIEPNDFAARETGGSIYVSGCRPLSRARSLNLIWTWGLRPRLYAYARYRGLRGSRAASELRGSRAASELRGSRAASELRGSRAASELRGSRAATS